MAFLEDPKGTFTPTQVEKTQQSLTYAIDRYLAILRHLYTVAKREWNMDIENPVSQVTRCRESRPRTRFLSDDERQRLLAACKQSHNGYLYPIVMLALSTGMRKMEILNLNWADIDFDHSLVYVRDSKNGEPRAVALTGPILTILRDLRDSQELCAHCDLVFASPNACRPLDFDNSWYVALRRSGVKSFVFHDTRHTAASYLAMNGATLVDIAAILGHRDLKQTMRYAHLSQHHTRGILERMTSTL